mgnify:CR=1 FL=1
MRRGWQGPGEKALKPYTNPQIGKLIDDHIHHARDRRIMKLHYIDGLSADTISRLDENRRDVPVEIRIDIQPRQISRILSDRLLEIDEYL